MKLALLCSFAILLSSCAQLGPFYDKIAPATQFDHELSEFGAHTVTDAGPHDHGRVEDSEFSLIQPKPLERGRPTYIILQVDGGGIMGITPANLLARIEVALQQRSGFSEKTLKDVVSLCSGTSTGAIIVGGVAAGIPARRISDFYAVRGYELFRKDAKLPLAPILQYRYNREIFQSEMLKILKDYSDYEPTVRLGELSPSPSLMIAAYDLVGKRTVFLRNQKNLDAPINTEDIQLVDAMSASAVSAAVYFGKLPAPEVQLRHINADGTGYVVKGAIFADGGQGTQTSTVALAAIEALKIRKADPEAQVVIISLGCGNDFEERAFDNVVRFRAIHQLTDFLVRNQARSESILLQWMATMKMEDIVDHLKLFRFDWNHPSSKDANSFSINAKQRQFLIDKADEIAERADFRQLMADLADEQVRLKQFSYR